VYSQTKEARAAGTATGNSSALGRGGVLRKIVSQEAEQSCSTEHSFTPDQRQAFDRLAPIFRGDVPGARATLTGYAGTGKTFLTARLIRLALDIAGALGFRDARGRWEELPAVAIVTPTHKAARQLERALAAYGHNQVKVTTLHSALGMRPVREEGVETFQPDPRASLLIGESTVLVALDEASMVSAGLAGLLEQVMPQGAALVAIGDPAQLQPVDDPAPCPLLEAPISAHLSEVVRHAGPILALATETRELGIGRPAFISRRGDRSRVVAHEGFGAWKRVALRACRTAAQGGDIDSARVLCWTNAAADRLNLNLHRAIYGPSALPYVVGQPVVSNGVILAPDGAPLIGSTCEMELLSVTPGQGALGDDEIREVRDALLGKRKTKAGEPLPPFDWWEIEARISGGRGRHVSFQVICQEHLPNWRKANNTIAALARTEKEAGDKAGAKELWGMFWRRKDRFAAINPVWAMTVHKAQGSTFEQVFLHPDLDRNQDPAALNQLAYVGITRASQALHVIAGRRIHANEARALEVAA